MTVDHFSAPSRNDAAQCFQAPPGVPHLSTFFLAGGVEVPSDGTEVVKDSQMVDSCGALHLGSDCRLADSEHVPASRTGRARGERAMASFAKFVVHLPSGKLT